jgi:hypothetical protein
MHPKMIAKQIIDFNKSSFDKTFTAINLLQAHTEKMIKSFLENATFFPEEGKKVISDWMETCKKGRSDFKTVADDKFKLIEDLIIGAANTMDSSLHELADKADQSLKETADKIKKVSVEVIDKSIQTIATVADKTIKQDITVKKEEVITGKPGDGTASAVRNAGKKPVKKIKK